ncbi:DUF5723 family protein [Cytophagaceae bacterium DM2B3-1]|uniref:DUF5723 family protein n=1 Tax=Xanthocytophaga flava TaxID=3048013 RepID=A0ABT7CJW2_9BACT|nr:DUF5723 family protein [Xanthocytophaga flavus]MDJ1494029.1 DUF5723 family protein [Xanthocytophaga flavus]
MLKKVPFLIFIFCITVNCSWAQQLLGISNSNYAGVNGVYLNPSSIADSRYGFHLNLVTVQGSITNNYYRYDSPYSLLKLGIERFKEPYNLQPEYYTDANNNHTKMFNIRANIYLPSLMIKLSSRHSIAVTNRMRGSFEVTNLTSFVAEDFKNNNLTLLSLLSNGSLLRINTNMFRETGLTYAREIWSEGKHYLKGGITLKYLQGIYSSSLYSNTLQSQFSTVNNEPVLHVINTDIGYHYSQAEGYPPVDEFADAALWKTKNGKGLGADIGFTYEYRPDVEKYRYKMDGKDELDGLQNKYKYRIGISLIDIGGLRYNTNYNDSTASASYAIRRTDVDLSQQELENSTLDNFYPVLNRGLAVGSGDQKNGFRTKLPTALHLNFDYKIKDKLYVNAAWIQSLRTRKAIGMRYNSQFAVTPRFETKHFEFALPLALVNDYQQVTVGAMMRVGSFFFIGSDNLPGLVNLGRPYGMDVYAGIIIAGLHHKKKDKDNDGVSDKLDICPNFPGVWEFKGCPDTDGDGIEDKVDKCPTEPGSKEMGGCSDRDGDRIMDSQDRCPDEAGLEKNGGCPDSDSDGVIDREDECPLLKGPAALKGCPDMDEDGIPDKDDRCPNEKGQSKFNGCADTDGDNIANPDDACPDQAGTPRFNGCPDRDGDTVPDKDDRCPDTYGSPQNAGCPVEAKPADPTRVEIKLTQEEQAVLNEAFDNLEFETGKSVIKVASYQSLDELADLLISKSTYRMLVSGHTDNVGNAATNLKLSKARAEAVKKYLTRKGVKADQVITEGFGSRKPVVSNATPEGRQRNRRVEMKIIK